MIEGQRTRLSIINHKSLIENLQCTLFHFDLERLDDVVDFHVIEAGDLHTALEAFAHFLDVVLDSLEGIESDDLVGGRIDHDAGANDSHTGAAFDHAAGDITTGDGADLADLERLANDRTAEVNDLLDGLEAPF